MVRLPGWERAFSNYLAQMKNEEFNWGVNDCVLFACRGCEVITGVNLYDEYLGYSTEEEADLIIEKNGGFTGLVGKHLGPGHRDFMKAKRGDFAMVLMPKPCLGLIDDSGQFIAIVSEKGFARIPISKARRIWTY